MSVERSGWSGMSPPVTKRLMVTIMFFIGSLCIVGGYVLARMTQKDQGGDNDIVFANFSINAENLYKKAKRISPKAIHHSDPEKVVAHLLDIFHYSPSEYGQTLYVSTLVTKCGQSDDYVPEFIKHSIKFKVIKLMQAINNASVYLDTLR